MIIEFALQKALKLAVDHFYGGINNKIDFAITRFNLKKASNCALKLMQITDNCKN